MSLVAKGWNVRRSLYRIPAHSLPGRRNAFQFIAVPGPARVATLTCVQSLRIIKKKKKKKQQTSSMIELTKRGNYNRIWNPRFSILQKGDLKNDDQITKSTKNDQVRHRHSPRKITNSKIHKRTTNFPFQFFWQKRLVQITWCKFQARNSLRELPLRPPSVGTNTPWAEGPAMEFKRCQYKTLVLNT